MNIHAAVEALNSAFAADPDSMQALFCVRMPCNQALADHPTVQVSKEGIAPDSDGWTVSVLGLLNGVVEPLTGLRIATKWTDTPINEFGQYKLLGFQVYGPSEQNGIAVVPKV